MGTEKKLNILLIMSDQHRYDCTQKAGHPIIKTPNIDRIGNEGMWFTHAFTPIPTTCPAKQCFLSGKWAEIHGGYWNYDITLQPPHFNEHVWTQDLWESGYRMGYVGRWMTHPWRRRDPEPKRTPMDFGFDSFRTMLEYVDWREGENLPKQKMDEFFWFGGVDPVETSQTRTHWYARKAVELIELYTKAGKPWHIRLDFEEPHLVCVPTRAFLDLYDPNDIEEWPNFKDDFKNKPYIQKQMRVTWGIDDFTWEQWKIYMWRYLAIISQFDDAIGIVLDALEKLGAMEDTVVMYTSDHGDAAGSHGLIDKHNTMYEELVHVPLAIRWPGVIKPESVCDAMTNHFIDLPPTLCEIGGIQAPEDFQGKSLMSHLKGETPSDWPQEVFSTYNGQQFGLYTERMIRDRQWKYVWNPTDIDELYNLEEDPWEIENRVTDSKCADILDDMRHRLLDHLKETGDFIVKKSYIIPQLSESRKATYSWRK